MLLHTRRLKACHIEITYEAQLLDARDPEHGRNADRHTSDGIQTVHERGSAPGRDIGNPSSLEEGLELVVDSRLGVVLVHNNPEVGTPIRRRMRVRDDHLDS